MQTLLNLASFTIILHGLLLQTMWLFVGRRARDKYLGDIMSFRSPASRLSRYYHWRVSSFQNALLEGIVFMIILIGSIIVLTTTLYGFEAMMSSNFIVFFIVFLSFISVLQHAWRVREVVDSEARIVASVGYSKDKIGVTREMVENLYLQGPMGDGRTWFALFRLAQRPDVIGWTVRDVLIETGKREDSRFQKNKTGSSPLSDSGPGIDS